MVMRRNSSYTAGEMRHPVVVQRPTYADDGAGGRTTTWSDYATIYCQIDTRSGSEPYSETTGRLRSRETYVFVTWFRDDIRTIDRLVYNDNVFNITDVSDELKNTKFLEIKADTGVEVD